MAIFAVLMLGGCESRGEEAERRYNIVAKNGSYTEKCAEAEKVADAYLQDENAKKYDYWRTTASIDCGLAKYQP